MDKQNCDQRQSAKPINLFFLIGAVLCVCFAVSSISSFRKIEFAPVDCKLNPNAASVYELMELPAIGAARAEAITEYRKNGRFENAGDLEKIKGIGEKTANKLKPFLKFDE
jgi:competence ComEA-like helix-hairpin-helix protein